MVSNNKIPNPIHSIISKQIPDCNKKGKNTMAKAKNYSNYVEVVGNVATIYQKPTEKNFGEMRFRLINHRSWSKDDKKGTEDTPVSILVKKNRRWAKQDIIEKGKFIRVIGHLEDNSYKDADGKWHGGLEISADKIVELKKREDGKVENTETGQAEEIDQNVEEEGVQITEE